jgi:hypothetical protein
VEENSAYRMVGKQFCAITNDAELAEVDTATTLTPDAIREHIEAALGFPSDRKNPKLP